MSAADDSVMSIAGLWDEWQDPATSESVLSCTLIVTTANDFTRRIHDRMPVLLCHLDLEAWLTRLHQLRGLGDAKLLKSLGRSFKGRHYRG
jgi:putative SOS response-associated peptidase YedK